MERINCCRLALSFGFASAKRASSGVGEIAP
jgi:hypothetical protein